MLLDDLLAHLPLGYPLPGVRFFEPRQAFLSWAQTHLHDRLIYDVGAGTGHVSRCLETVGLRVLPLDICDRGADSVRPVQIANGVTYPYAQGSIVLLCRPCHGRLVAAVIRQALRRRVRGIVYVGFGKNLAGDLDRYRTGFRRALTHAGKAMESVWVSEVA